ncbi:TolC family protein [Ramlibacter sp.]|uniref:TolC family protein n=1 Tax=Ramlibacter sp. TaxID=1917967 RepID=UPI00185B2E59|nr:TolC family protein [Ramlibacter sp.]MBA2676143.1 TolC family protein [Ramlibacter sp.]
MHIRSGLATAALLFFLGLPAAAQQSLTLAEAQRLALERSQQLAASDAAAAAVRELSVAAGQLPDPVLKLGVDNLPVDGPDRFSLSRDFMTMRRIGVMQELTRPDKRRLKVERLAQDGKRIQAEREQAVVTIQRDTALAWIERRYGQAMVQLVERQLRETELQIQGAEVAFRGGRGSQADVFAARMALANLQDKLRQIQRQLRSAGLALARWAGPQAASAAATGDVPWQDTPLARSLPDHLQQQPGLQALAAQADAAETEVRLAQASTRPDVTVEAMYSQRGSAYSNMVSVGVSIPLQLDRSNRQDREVAAKVATLAEARARYQDALAAQESSAATLLNDWQAGKERLRALQADLLPAARNRTQAALTAYGTGKADLASVLAARREELDALMQLLTLEMETARLWAQLHYLVHAPVAKDPS